MGCDIHAYVEIRTNDIWRFHPDIFPINQYNPSCPFDEERSYPLFGFLANVRNYSRSPVISPPRGLPEDVSPAVKTEADSWGSDGHNHSWLTLADLAGFDYDQTFVDRWRDPPAEIRIRDFLGDWYFKRLALLSTLGNPDDVRIVFWFDN
jgi:hypothetical protein